MAAVDGEVAHLSASPAGTPVSTGPEERLTVGHDEHVPHESESLGRPSTRVMVAALLVAVGMACIMALAALSASAEAGGEEAASSGGPVGPRAPSAAWEARRAAAQQPAWWGQGCREVEEGEPCHRHIMWAKKEGIREHADWYPGLTENSSVEDFQALLHMDPFAKCPRPCGATSLQSSKANESGTVSAAGLAYETSGRVVAQGQWCSVNEPAAGWGLHGCGTARGLQIKVLTYNLFWWNLFGRRGGNGGSAGKLIAGAHWGQKPFDIMGFQECDGIGWVLGDAGLQTEFAALPGPHALCMAYRKNAWNILSEGSLDVAEDRPDQWYGTRAGMWVRLQHRETGQTVLAMNHHGPLPLESGGRCGGEATAFNILKLMAEQAQGNDVILLFGDFNAGPASLTVQSFGGRLHKIISGQAFGGIDHVLSSCANQAWTRNLGSGGSDHDAIEVVIQL